MGRLAFSHPGKMGDALYSLPAIKYITEQKNTTADFYTSEYCKPITRLLEYQPYVDNVYIPDNYEITGTAVGIQPYHMPIDGGLYDTVWQLGFKQVPSCSLPEFIGRSAGIGNSATLPIKYEYPDIETLDEDYIVLSARGNTIYNLLFVNFVDTCPIKVVAIGGPGDYRFNPHPNLLNITGLDMLETTTWIAKSKGFVGLMSAMLVLANGFDIPKVAPHDGIHWDMRHVITSPNNHYPILPDVPRILELLNI